MLTVGEYWYGCHFFSLRSSVHGGSDGSTVAAIEDSGVPVIAGPTLVLVAMDAMALQLLRRDS